MDPIFEAFDRAVEEGKPGGFESCSCVKEFRVPRQRRARMFVQH
jgi:hypothetical protein